MLSKKLGIKTTLTIMILDLILSILPQADEAAGHGRQGTGGRHPGAACQHCQSEPLGGLGQGGRGRPSLQAQRALESSLETGMDP